MSLRIYLVAGAWGTGNGAPGIAKYDNLKLLSSSGGPTSITVPNSGFEIPSLGFGNFQYGPTGGSWNFINGAGISAGGSGFTGGPFIPQGSQVAFIQSNGEFSQSLSGFQANTNYVITFFAAQRTNCCNAGGQQFAVYLDGTLLGTFNPPLNGVYVEYSTTAFTTTAGSHTVKFVGLNPGGQAGFIDHVRITGSPLIGNGVQWLVADHLGTPRMIIDESGSLGGVKRHDYLPFGEELFGGTVLSPGPGGRLTDHGYTQGDDDVRQQFTAKERDVETGLDYFGARYFGSVLGRFTSIDPIKLAVARLYDPQRINLYSYCRSNPLNYRDPDGQDLILANANAQAQARANIDANLRQSERSNVAINGNKVQLVNPSAIDLKTASPGYRKLAEVIKSNNVVNYFGLKPGETVTSTSGTTVTYEDARAGLTHHLDNGDADVFVPVGGAPEVYATNNADFVDFPEDLVFGHEVYGHSLCGQGQCAVDVENELRSERGLPLRSGRDHHSLPGERPGNQGSTKQNVDVVASPDVIKTTTTVPATTITPKPLQPLLPVPPPPKP